MKIKCFKCSRKAVWMYLPSSERDWYNNFYCDDCISRGCSCNQNEDGTMPLDDKGREYPCCEYDFNPDGYNEKEEEL